MTKEKFVEFLCTAPQDKIDALAFKSLTKEEYFEFIKLLIFKRLIINPKNKSGQGLLHVSVILNNIECVKLLVDSGFDVNETDDDLRTPLHLGVMSNINSDILSHIIKNGADINAKTERLETPLFLACQSNNETAVKILLETGNCDISYPNDLGQEPIFLAYRNNNKTILKLFKEYKEKI
jgi:ankyrin repeat protein